MSEALVSAMTTVASDATGAISSILPVALPVMGAFVVVKVGIRIFKMVTGK